MEYNQPHAARTPTNEHYPPLHAGGHPPHSTVPHPSQSTSPQAPHSSVPHASHSTSPQSAQSVHTLSGSSLSASRPVLQYRKPGWRLRAIEFSSKVHDYPVMKMRVASIAQVVLGVVCMAASIAVIAVSSWGHQIGAGLWGGALFTFTGGIGIVAFMSLKLGFVSASFLLSTASFLIAFVLFVVSCVGIEQDLQDMSHLTSATRHNIVGLDRHLDEHRKKVAFNSVLLFMAILELIVALAHALLNGRHFFVWDEGCTSESPYVYSNEGAEVEPDLPPTYQEAMGTTISPDQGAQRAPSMELQLRPEREQNQYLPAYGEPRVHKEAPPSYDQPVNLGRGLPEGAQLEPEPMYRRPQRVAPPAGEPIYANVHDYAHERPLTEEAYDRAPPRPPYPEEARGRLSSREASYEAERRPHEEYYRRPQYQGYPSEGGYEGHYPRVLDVESHM